MTQVKFLIHKEEDGNADIFAFFPDDHYHPLGHPDYKEMFLSYAHVGQHSACHIAYANECKEAPFADYQDLLIELKRQGYRDLKVLNSKEVKEENNPFTGGDWYRGVRKNTVYSSDNSTDFKVEVTGNNKEADARLISEAKNMYEFLHDVIGFEADPILTKKAKAILNRINQ